jgi:hypothetical protein
MAYLGNNLQVAYPSYRVIDDISSQFNGSLKTFALKVAGSTPVPFPVNPQQCLISVNSIVQKPDSTGASGFTLTGSNIVFATAPTLGWSFFGTVLAGADYVNLGANFPSGTAAVPSISFDANTNTGLYLASSNVLGIATGGVQRVVVDSSGFVGIGTASPGTLFDIGITGGMARIGGASGNNLSQVYTGSNGLGMWAGGIPRFYSTGNMTFSVNSTIGTSIPTGYVDAMTINSSGKVGIGTASPGYALDVLSTDTTAGIGYGLRVRQNSTAAAAAIQFTDANGTIEYGYIASDSSSNLKFTTNNNERLRIDSSGRLGIGTSSPAFALDISAPNDTVVRSRTNGNTSAGFIGSTNNGTNNWFIGSRKDSTGGTSGTDRFNLLYDTNAFLTVTTAGNVGIGTTSPGSALDVLGNIELGTKGASNNTVFFDITSDTTYTDYGFRIIRGGAANANTQLISRGTGALELNCVDGGYLGFSTSNNERLRIDSSGRLLVGTSTARTDYFNNTLTAMFQVEGTNSSGAVDRACVSIVNNNALTVNESPVLILGRSNGATLNSKTTVVNGTRCGYISFQGADGSDLIDSAGIAGEVDGTPGANDMPGRLVFSTTADGASSPTERMRITSDGYMRMAASTGGIQFNGDTAAVNALDDYEEGTWTPTDASGAGLSFTAVNAYYTKIGRFVTCQFNLTYPSTASGSDAKIGGLPFINNVNGGGFSMYTTSAVGSIAVRNQTASQVMILTYGNDQDLGIANSTLSLSDIQITFMYQVGA